MYIQNLQHDKRIDMELIQYILPVPYVFILRQLIMWLGANFFQKVAPRPWLSGGVYVLQELGGVNSGCDKST